MADRNGDVMLEADPAFRLAIADAIEAADVAAAPGLLERLRRDPAPRRSTLEAM